jgi:hypothetical protein
MRQFHFGTMIPTLPTTVQVQTQTHTLQQEYLGTALHDLMQPSKRK